MPGTPWFENQGSRRTTTTTTTTTTATTTTTTFFCVNSGVKRGVVTTLVVVITRGVTEIGKISERHRGGGGEAIDARGTPNGGGGQGGESR